MPPLRRSAHRVAAFAGALLAGACGEGSGGGPGGSASAADGFCARVTPRVDAWLERARAAHPPPDDPRYGGTVVAAGIGELGGGGMNAFLGDDYAGRMHQQFVNLMTLVRYDEKLEPRPYLAESWEVSADGTSVTFRLRRDVVWHDGEPTTARDVAFTFARMTDPATSFPNAQFWAHWVPGPDGVEVLDDHTIRLRMEPHAEFLDPWQAVAIMPEHLLGDVPPEELARHPYGTRCPVGNGPFVFREHRPQDRWVFAADPAFSDALGGRPFVDRYVFRVIPEQATLLTELLTGGIDAYIQPRPDQVAAIEADPSLELRSFQGRQYTFIAWNGRIPELADARVRRALAMGWDRAGFVEATLGRHARVANASVPPAHWAFDPDVDGALPYDPDSARALLDAAGWRDRDGDGVRESAGGVPLSITVAYNEGNQVRQSAAEMMQAQLRDLGVDIRPRAAEYRSLVQRAMDPALRDFEGMVLAWNVEFRLDDTDLFHSDRIDQPFAFSGTRSPTLDSLLERLGSAVDRDAARPLWSEYQRAVAREQPYLFLYHPDRLVGLNRRVRGAIVDARGEWVNVKDWWIDGGR